MNRTNLILGAAAVLSLLVPACKGKKTEEKSPEPAVKTDTEMATDPAEPAKPSYAPEQIARGEYLVEKVMVCGACHTNMGPSGPDRAKHLGGGLEVPEVFGTWRAPNITADPETGIGNWTDEQIVTAIRAGVRPSGEQLYPIMPYTFYRRLSDYDAMAVVAYLRSVPPVSNKVEPTGELQLPKVPVPGGDHGPKDDTELGRGEYLGNLMKCGHCHMPLTDKGEPDLTRPFAGGMAFELAMLGTGTSFASNITSDKKTGIGEWTKDQIVTSLRTMTRPNGTPIQVPMAMFAPGWSQLTDEDLGAVATWVASLPPVENKVPSSTFKLNAPPIGAPGELPAEQPAPTADKGN